MRAEHLSLAQARRIALAAQGFGVPRPATGTVGRRDLHRVARRLGVVQIDSVNVLSRSHYLPFFSRLGPYAHTELDALRDTAPRRLVEYWAHEASLIPVDYRPLFEFRMCWAEEDSWGGMQRVAREHPDLVAAVLAEVTLRGPLTSREVERALAHDHQVERTEWGWNWSKVKAALEYLFWSGRITSAGRTSQFERRYAALDRVARGATLAGWLDPPEERTAYRQLVEIAARAHGIGTVRCLADYFRLPGDVTRTAIDELVAEDVLAPVTVTGWGETYLHREARRPRTVHVEALVSPFDSLVWQRERTEALFGVRFRLEIYVPAPKRVHGYYVLPFFYGDRIVARVDLKADRAAGTLIAHLVTWEPDAPVDARAALDRELGQLATWLALPQVRVDRHTG